MADVLDSRQLRAFRNLARNGSFTQTAAELSLTQSAVSHSIKALEAQVGCLLFDRLGKKAVLTQAGEALQVHAEMILAAMEAAVAELKSAGRWDGGRIRIGATNTACQYVLPPVLREFRESFPQCSVTIIPGDTAASLEALRSHRVDVVVSLEPPRMDGLKFRPLFSDELEFVVSPHHPWARKGRVDRPSISSQQYIVYSKASLTFGLVSDYFRGEGILLHSLLELGSMEAIKELVMLGQGVGILAPWTLQKEIRDGALFRFSLGRRKLRRRWGVLTWREYRLSLAEETFVGLCEAVTEGWGKA